VAFIPLRAKFRPKLISPKLKARDFSKHYSHNPFVCTMSPYKTTAFGDESVHSLTSRGTTLSVHTFHLINGAKNRNAGEQRGARERERV
jgi:hypothetical protein